MKSNFILVFFMQIIILSHEQINVSDVCSTTQPSADLHRLIDILNNLDQRIKNIETEECSRRFHIIERQITQLQDAVTTQIAATEKRLENLSRKAIRSANCREVQLKGHRVSGTYLIWPDNSLKPFDVLCDMETRGGGWTYFLNRFDGSQNFYLNWTDYKTGFGRLSGEFWLGLENLHQLAGYEANELLVELTDFDGNKTYALYNDFVVGSEEEGYAMKTLGTYSGNAGDSLRYHAGMKFTTQDKENDLRPTANCATQEKGSWWYNSCTNSHLTGMYLKGPSPSNTWQIMYWETFRGAGYSLKTAKMMVRPKN